jgi:gliding motility associated protien GldN
MNRRSIVLGVLTLIGVGASVTSDAQTVLDGAYIKEHTKTQRVVPYPHIREADVMWYRRVWRDIDLTEKINHPLYYPTSPINDRKSLFDVIKQGILDDGSITAYDAGVDGWDDEFIKMMLVSQVKEKLIKMDTLTRETLEGEQEQVIQEVETKSEDIRRYRFKGDWIFDKQR